MRALQKLLVTATSPYGTKWQSDQEWQDARRVGWRLIFTLSRPRAKESRR